MAANKTSSKGKKREGKLRRRTWRVLTPENMRMAIEHYAGNIIQIAEAFKIQRATVYAFIERNPGFDQLLKDARKILVGEAKQALRNAIRREEGWAVNLTLLTLGKDEGFVKGQIIAGGQDSQGNFTPVQITLPHNGRDEPDPEQLSTERLPAITDVHRNGEVSDDESSTGTAPTLEGGSGGV